ncbi:MAG: Ig-like domain-containing protein, partial [Anaerolineales bacterium]|nr:Ig-like domain-containing protein [Anaerolineales bacterium]
NVDALITLKDTDVNGTDIPFDATINSTKTVITINPTADFASEQTVYVSISASLEDSLDHGTSAASATLKMKDVISPLVTFYPVHGSQDVAANTNITLTFSEPIRKIDNSEITASSVGGLITLKATNASGGDFNFSATINTDKTVITVDPLFDFSPNTTVYVAIGATVEDDADNAIVASSAVFLTGIPDLTGPTVSNVTSANVDSSYKDESSIVITVSFDEVAIVTGTPQLTLETGTTDGVANYSSGSGTKDLYFTYNVTSDHNTAHLDYISSNALTKNEGTIKDFVGNSANLALPNPGAEGSLGANKNIIIDN